MSSMRRRYSSSFRSAFFFLSLSQAGMFLPPETVYTCSKGGSKGEVRPAAAGGGGGTGSGKARRQRLSNWKTSALARCLPPKSC